MRRGLKILVGLAMILGLGYGAKSCRDSVCGYDPQDEVAIPGTSWTIYARVYGCSALGGVTDVVAINRTTAEEVPIISFSDTINIKLRATTSTRRTVELDNKADVKELHDSFDGIAIVYEYHPDDPEARAFYQLSRNKPDDPRVKQAHQAK